MDGKKTCFVISPIGAADSAVRKDADDLFDLVVKPALQIFDFDVVRADHLVGTGQITTDIIELVQQSELCIIDLTGANPNVYYEAGRRHETGKPFIQLIQHDQALPFDVSGIRSIFYDLRDPRKIRTVCDLIQAYVHDFEQRGYGAASPGFSLGAIAAAIDRIDRRLDRLTAAVAETRPSVPVPTSSSGGIFQSPRSAFQRATVTGDYPAMVNSALRWLEIAGPNKDALEAVALCATAGERRALDALMNYVKNGSSLDEPLYRAVLQGWLNYFVVLDRESDIADEAESLIAAAIERYADPEDPSIEAHYLNQLQRILFAARRIDRAFEIATRTVDLAPDDPAYRYNLSLCAEMKGFIDLAESEIRAALALESGTPSRANAVHLAQAYDIFLAQGKLDDAEQAISALEAIDPALATQTRARTTSDADDD